MMEDGRGERQLLFPAERNGRDQRAGLLFHVKTAETFVDPVLKLFARDFVDSAEQLHILKDRQVVVKGEALAHVADMFLDEFRLGEDVITRDGGRTRRRQQQTAHHLDGRGLPRTVGAQKAENLTALHLEADVIHGSERSELLGKLVCYNTIRHP